MKPNPYDSIAARVCAEIENGRDPWKLESWLLQDLTKPVEEWLNGQSEIDLFYCSYVLEAAYKFVMSILADDDREQLENLKMRYHSMGVKIPVKKEREK